MALRDYQLKAVEDVRAEYRRGVRSVCLVMPTGAGKTKTAAIGMVTPAVAKGRRVIWVVNRIDLVDQAADVLTGIGLTVGAVCAGARTPPQPFAPVQIATPQTLLARAERPPADFVIADEAHHFASARFAEVLQAYPAAHVLGLTATPERGDGIGLGSVFRALVLGPTVAQLTQLGHLTPAEILRPAGKLRPGQIAQRPVDVYLQHARGRRALVFSTAKLLAERVRDDFRAAGLGCELVVDSTPGSERRRHFAALAAGEIAALSGVGVFTEGFDLPAVDCVILSRFFGHSGGYLQAVGRALRPSPGKSDALILDLTGTSHDHGLPTDERLYSLDGRGIRRGDGEPEINQAFCRVCGAPATPGEACPECGTEPRTQDVTVTGEKIDRYAGMKKQPDDKRIANLAGWLVVQRTAKKKDGSPYSVRWAAVKYQALYGEWPPPGIMSAALEKSREKQTAVDDGKTPGNRDSIAGDA